MYKIEDLREKIQDAIQAATMERASFCFPDDRIEIKAVHFGDDRRGDVGDVLHPDKYIRNITELYRKTWIIAPLREALMILAPPSCETADNGEPCERLGFADDSGEERTICLETLSLSPKFGGEGCIYKNCDQNPCEEDSPSKRLDLVESLRSELREVRKAMNTIESENERMRKALTWIAKDAAMSKFFSIEELCREIKSRAARALPDTM